jgi:glycosyltransferase involved in cell wall biosynthesis
MALGKASSAVWLVLHLQPKKRGSLEEQLLALARRLHSDGTRLTCVFTRAPLPWLHEAFVEAGMEVRVLDLARPLAAALTLGRWLRAARPRLVHFHFLRAYSPLVAAARASGARVVVHDHVTLTRATDSVAREAVKRVRSAALNPLCDRRVAVSQFVAASVIDVERVARDHVEVIENGIHLERFAGADGRRVRAELDVGARPLIVCVSRLDPVKGVDTAIRALPLVGRGALLAVVGDGPRRDEYQALARALGIGGDVRFLGLRDDVEEILAAGDVAVVPSHWEEAFGLAVAEGMAAGRPVIVSASGAMPSLVGDTGLVVPKRDPAALAGAITRLVDDPLLAARLGRAAAARASRFAMGRFVESLVDLYRRLGRPLDGALAA